MVIVFDLDGVVYRGDTPLPGAVSALAALSRAGHSLYFLTNNSTRSRAHYADKLTRMGIPTGAEQVVTSSYLTGRYLAERGGAGKRAYLVGEHGMAEELRLAGVEIAPDDGDEPVDYVVVGLDRNLTYARLARAHELIQRGARFIATNRDATYPVEDGREIPGGGAMVAALEHSTGVRAVTIGKPEPYPWRHILATTGVAPADALMVGDRPETDVLGAKRLGMRTALVLTGVTRGEAVANLPEEQRPDAVLTGVAELPALLEAWAVAVR